MGLMITASDATVLGDRVWLTDMPPHQVRLFGQASQATGPRSIILLKQADYDEETGQLQFDADDVVPLNVGTLSEAILIGGFAGGAVDDAPEQLPYVGEAGIRYGPGDREFLELTKRLLPSHIHTAAEALLSGVRRKSSGDLKRGKAKNFSDTPDNFWYVIVQPRVEQLSITVRGSVDHFQGIASLPIKDDRGNTLFKVSGEEDVPDALKLIFHAIRKPG